MNFNLKEFRRFEKQIILKKVGIQGQKKIRKAKILINLGAESFLVENGARIAQIVLCPIIKANLKEVKTLEDTKRGSGGFGSTGTK